MKISVKTLLLSFLLLPVVSTPLDPYIVSAFQTSLLIITIGASLIAVLLFVELFKMYITEIAIKVPLIKCPKCGKIALLKTYEGMLLVSYACEKCEYHEIKERTY